MMRLGLTYLMAVAGLAAASANGQTTGSAQPVTPVQPGSVPASSLPPQRALPALPGRQPPAGQSGSTLPTWFNPNAQALGQTNRVPMYGGASNQTQTATFQDRALTPADQILLLRVRQTVRTQMQRVSPWTPVHFEVQNGVVTLVGNVQTAELSQEIVAAVRQTPGVVNVVDQLHAGGAPPQASLSGPDRLLLLRVRQQILPQIQVGGTAVPVDFQVHQGEVTIVGTVPNIQQSHYIAAMVRQVPGVIQVRDQLQVNPNPNAAFNRGMVGSSTTTPTPSNALNPSSGNPIVQTNLTPTGRPAPPGYAPRPGLSPTNRP